MKTILLFIFILLSGCVIAQTTPDWNQTLNVDNNAMGMKIYGMSMTQTDSLTTPLIIGGTATTQTLIYKTTTGVGATGARHIFQVGNNGATEAMTILNNGNVGIGTTNSQYKLGFPIQSFLGAYSDATHNASIQLYSLTGAINFQLTHASAGGFNFIKNTALLFTILPTGNVGIGVTSPTAVLHLKAGTATASTAPLKFNSGALNTTAEAGAVEFLTDAYYGTITTGAARKTFAFLESPTFTGKVTINNGSFTSAQTTAPTIAVTTQAGITAAAITAGSTDTKGVITTTGTNNNTGYTTLTVTFNVDYTSIPVVVFSQTSTINLTTGAYQSYVVPTTGGFALWFFAANGTANPSFNYFVIE